jgi:hypothetical protein
MRAVWKVWRWLVARDGLILVKPDKSDEPAREPDYSLADLGREVRNFGSALLSLVRGRWGR